MKLRARLAAAVVAAALPLAAATVWFESERERSRTADVLREFAVTRMEAGGRERCEADPAMFPQPPRGPQPAVPAPGGVGPAPPPVPFDPDPVATRSSVPPPPPLPERERRTRFWAYGPAFESANPEAPGPAEELIARMRGGADVALRSYEGPSGVGHEALVRMAWSDGPCTFVLVRRTVSPAERGRTGGGWWAAAIVVSGVLVAVLLAFGPVVRRIRRLRSDVRASADGTYARGVEVSGTDEITALAAAFNAAAAEVRARVEDLHAREETLRRFVANTTHDLMTPLTVLHGHLSLLRDALEDARGDAQESVRAALREVDYTTSLVANLSTAAKLEADPGGPARHAVVLNDLVDRVAARFAPVARAHEVELNHAVPAEPLTVLGDVTLLEQAVGNLVQNAVRYNRPGGHVAVVLRGEGASFHLQVQDDGPGVPEAELSRLTERGRRGEAARSRADGGRGLGLDIARDVCERHGLELRFARSVHGGLSAIVAGALEV